MSKMASFWWKNSQTGKGIHWKSWAKLCKPKSEGGIGFRDLNGFNLALLTKQLWRMLVSPSSLVARVYKSRYFPNSNPLEAKLGTRPSYAWRSIHEAQTILKLGTRKEFGTGKLISIFKDPWIQDPSPRAPRANPEIDQDAVTLSFLIDPGSDEWNVSRVKEVFVPEDVNLVLQIKPKSFEKGEAYTWIFNNFGEYTVKSGYWLWSDVLRHKEDDEIGCSRPNINPILSLVWKTPAAPKIHHFLWRCLTNTIPVMSNLKKKRLTADAQCPRCGEHDESVNHLLFLCPYARLVWALSPIGALFHPSPSDSIFCNMFDFLQPTVPDETLAKRIQSLAPWLLWRIWKGRNTLSFNAQNEDAMEVLEAALRDEQDWLETRDPPPAPKPQCPPQVCRWSPPPPGFLKCNVDAAWKEDADTCGVGWILRTETGAVKWWGGKCFPRSLSPLEAEVTALAWAMSCLDNMGMKQVIFESDCLTLITTLSTASDWRKIDGYVAEITQPRRTLQPIFKCVARDSNQAADAISKSFLNASMYFASIECLVPCWLRNFLLTDQH